ncbi:putative sporulation protein YtxC [Hathewaya histolytica]|uniref:putative sporulation protein YtxC n=1 Tax=Hathewaya histolytica TaxID=1498 RepID=UPI003B6784CB
MLILTVVYDEKHMDFIEEISLIKNYFKVKDIHLGISEEMSKNDHFVKIYCDDENNSSSVRNNLCMYISMSLYNIIVSEFCISELENYIRDRYFFLKNSETNFLINKTEKILSSQKLLLQENDIQYINKKNDIIRKILECIKENEILNIDGFLRFRKKEIKEDLTFLADSIIQKYISEKEYKEFIRLLKYFVDIQESKIDEVNIIVKEGGKYSLKNKRGEDILDEILKGLEDTKFNESISVEDIIISGLITNVPKRIVIHSGEDCICTEFINTIKDVFLERVAFCRGCSFCNKNKYGMKL